MRTWLHSWSVFFAVAAVALASCANTSEVDHPRMATCAGGGCDIELAPVDGAIHNVGFRGANRFEEIIAQTVEVARAE